MDPIYFEFTFDEASLLRYQRMMQGASDIAGTPVELKLIDDKGWPYKGKMDFLNNVVDPETGTIRGRAVFENKNELFKPGMFGRVRIPAAAPYESLSVPDVAIGSQQLQKFVYVVGPENTVQVRPVVLGPLEGDRRVIKSGLQPDDVVVVNGLMRVRPGVKVTPQERSPQRQRTRRRPPPPLRPSEGGPAMRLSHFFIDRPIFAWVVSIVVVLLGAISYTRLPVAQYPTSLRPSST